ncbi:isoleucine--tRNA ligase [Nibricoccus sp. IMCC34717]|uniref:isoleucine--tRNA ligase n=1 Tax=Nibricoccus sp. IMCC34717 TaxID=3034021 RepID=UPI00384AF262
MRANLVAREPNRIAHWEKLGLYEAIQSKRADAPAWVLHDGPPFTNGDVHIGTALNKTLKDITLRYRSMRGFRTPYVPGWDCHGLPIEQKVAKELQASGTSVSTSELRARCDAFSESWIARQRTQFKRLGVLANWDAEYRTKHPAFEADILRTFAAFVEQGLVYRSKKPVYWSIPFETALAEAEIEYRDHTSPSIWVKFAVPAAEAAAKGLPTDKPLFVVIWTTTPWTLPANLAIALHPEVEYTVADSGAERLIVARALLESVSVAAKLPAPPTVVATVAGAALEGLQARHPFIDRASPIVLADYVTTDSGTGCVHTAPGHGGEDYVTGLKYGLEVYCPVGDDGRYIDDGRMPADFVGLTCLESVEDLEKKRTSPANIAVLKKLAATGALLAKQNLAHSYPHCWRSKTPIIFRAVDQWFVSLDRTMTSGSSPRATALAAIGGVQWIPTWGENRIRGAVEARPDWCISRQRSWGVPIIAFYDEKKTAWLDAGVVRAVAAKIETRGTNFWYESSAAEILAGVTLPAGWPSAEALTCGRDTLDVWIDSGSSHVATLKRSQGGTQWPADLYLEGSDQHRGWFQSSLWTGVIAEGAAPYKRVLTHGFIVGEDGKKISKSGQYEKPPTSDNFIAQYGADVIRLWIGSQNFTEDITLSEKILNNASEAYRQLRNTFRYQLSNLFDFEPSRDSVAYEPLDLIDKWALHQTATLIREATDAYEKFEYHRAVQLCNHFCSATLSAVYHDILKDRLYTLGTSDPLRRSSQTAIHHIFQALVRLLAPVLTFTADEAWAFSTGDRKAEYVSDSIHLQDWPVAPAAWTNPEADTAFAAILRTRSAVTEAIEPLRAAGKLGKSLDAAVRLVLGKQDSSASALTGNLATLPELFIVSQVDVRDGTEEGTSVEVHACESLGLQRCPRCWRWVPALETTSRGNACPRCSKALSA